MMTIRVSIFVLVSASLSCGENPSPAAVRVPVRISCSPSETFPPARVDLCWHQPRPTGNHLIGVAATTRDAVWIADGQLAMLGHDISGWSRLSAPRGTVTSMVALAENDIW